MGIILSGTGSDGMDGIRCIKEQSGMVMVQNNAKYVFRYIYVIPLPFLYRFDGMPQSAINTGLVDYMLPPDKMPEELLRYLYSYVFFCVVV